MLDDFGTLSKIDIVYNDKGQTIPTYRFTKKQAIAVAARLNNTMLMKVINRLEELEKQKPQFQIPAAWFLPYSLPQSTHPHIR